MKFLFHIELSHDGKQYHVYITSQKYWNKNLALCDGYTVAEEKAITPILTKLGLAEVTECTYESIDPEKTAETMKAELLAEGLLEDDSFSAFLTDDKLPTTPPPTESEAPPLADADHEIQFIGQPNGSQMDMIALLPVIKKLAPKSILLTLDSAAFEQKCPKLDTVSYLFENEENLTKFFTEIRETLKQEGKDLDKIDIYISDNGDVAFDRIGIQQKMETRHAQAIKHANKSFVQGQKAIASLDRKIEAVTEIVATNEHGQIQRFKVHGTYTDSRGRGKIDIDIERDINQDDIKALLDYKNEEFPNEFTLVGVAYDVTPEFFLHFSIGRYCADQLHVSVLQGLINDLIKTRDGINKPVSRIA